MQTLFSFIYFQLYEKKDRFQKWAPFTRPDNIKSHPIGKDHTMKILYIEDVMEILQVWRKTATKILSSKTCPMLPRVKGGKYMILKEDFEDYIKSAVIRGKW